MTMSTQTTTVNTPKKNFSPLPVGKYSKLTKQSTEWRHQANEGKSSFKAEWVWALGELRSLKSKKNLVAEIRRETHILSNEDKEQWIEDHVERGTAGARKWVEDLEATIRQEQDNTEAPDNAGLMTNEPEKMFHALIVAIWDRPSDITSSNDGQDGQDEDDEETEQGQLSENDEPGLVFGTINKTG